MKTLCFTKTYLSVSRLQSNCRLLSWVREDEVSEIYKLTDSYQLIQEHCWSHLSSDIFWCPSYWYPNLFDLSIPLSLLKKKVNFNPFYWNQRLDHVSYKTSIPCKSTGILYSGYLTSYIQGTEARFSFNYHGGQNLLSSVILYCRKFQ